MTMKKNSTKITVFLGVICALITAGSSWYSVVFNDSRFVAPMDLSVYAFRMQDLPMIVSGILFALYILYLFVMLMRIIRVKKQKVASSRMTKRVDPRLGLLGFFGFTGFLGFWTYHADKTVFPFVFFIFFGFFGFFYEGKLSATLMDERYCENKLKANYSANKAAMSIIFFATVFLGQGTLMGNLEYTFIAYIITVALAIALNLFLSSFLLYRYDHEELPKESEG